MRHEYEYHFDNVKICQLQQCDIEQLRIWRNNQDNCKFLKKIPFITKQQQQLWYETYLNDENVITFAIHENRELLKIVGSLSIYNICLDKAEIGHVMIGEKKAHGKGLGLKAMVAALSFCFKVFRLKQVYLHVYEENIAAFKIYKKAGFSVKSYTKIELRTDLIMEITRDEFFNKWK